MKVVELKGIRLKLLKLIEGSRKEGKPIDYIELSLQEYNVLLADVKAPPGATLNSYLGVPLEVNSPLIVVQ